MKENKIKYRKKENNFLNEKRQIALFEIFILIIGTIAFTYLIAETNEIGIVSAQETGRFLCCPETKDGAICQNIIEVDFDNRCKISSSGVYTDCENSANCKIGCCIDEEEGLCSERATTQECNALGGKWEDDETCNSVIECRNVCCLLGNDAYFVTENRCEKLSTLSGLESRVEQTNELGCLLLARVQKNGACVISSNSEDGEKNCKMSSEAECFQYNGKFNEGLLCTNEALDTNCEKTKETTCVEGKDEVYFLDSCGNVANIYDKSKENDEDYWNKVYSKAESCNSDSANTDSSSCGNCNYYSGSRCSATLNGNRCEDLNCVDSKGEKRKNGESWCVYDSNIGEETRRISSNIDSNFASDAVGSRHWKEYCIDGEVKVEPCSDFRNQICIQDEMEIPETNEMFSIASCKTNQGLSCFNYNSEDDPEERIRLCQENYDCLVKRINVDSGFKFDMCVPRYPTGFDLSEERGQTSSTQICGMASQKCTVVYKKKLSGGWDCIQNCDCEDKEFTEQMNDLCVSLGDCGSYVNYIGEGTDNIVVKKAPEISWKDYKDEAEIVEGKHAEIENITKFLESLGEFSYGNVEDEEQNQEQQEQGMFGGLASGTTGIGVALGMAGYALSTLPAAAPTFGGISAASLTGYEGMAIAANNPLTPSAFGAFANGLMAVGIGVAVGSIIGSLFGLEGESATIMAIAGAAAGIAYVWSQGWALTWSATAFFWAAAALVVIALILKVLGIGKTKKVMVEFECLPWQAPIGGDDCEKCNSQENRPCTEYRCQSLGTACELLNGNSDKATCIDSNPNDKTPPVISTSWIQEEYEFENEQTMRVDIRKDNGECIEEFSPLIFTLKTDEFAQCKFEMQETSNYEDMETYALEKTLFTKNHTFSFMIPSLESLEVYGVTGDLKERLGNLDLYVRCQDTHGNFNIEEYEVNFCLKSGPDETAPKLISSKPETNSFTKFQETEKYVEFYLNEPSECKWSKEDKSYDEMENVMDCLTDLEDVTEMGWMCSTTLNGLSSSENNFYVRCKDKPWLSAEQESERNVNSESYNYKLLSSSGELKIDSLSPSGEHDFGLEPISIDLKVSTSGGAENGKAICYYDFASYSKKNQFMETFSNSHGQTFNQMLRGKKTAYVLCEDVAGNQAKNETTFNLNIDTSAPRVVRVYDDGVLKIITDEDAECYYDFGSCGFNVEKGEKMTTGFAREHTAGLIQGKTYHVRCKDVFGNFGAGCTIKVSPTLN